MHCCDRTQRAAARLLFVMMRLWCWASVWRSRTTPNDALYKQQRCARVQTEMFSRTKTRTTEKDTCACGQRAHSPHARVVHGWKWDDFKRPQTKYRSIYGFVCVCVWLIRWTRTRSLWLKSTDGEQPDTQHTRWTRPSAHFMVKGDEVFGLF